MHAATQYTDRHKTRIWMLGARARAAMLQCFAVAGNYSYRLPCIRDHTAVLTAVYLLPD